MQQTLRRASSTRIGVRGAALVVVALFVMLLGPSLAVAIVAPVKAKSAPAPVNTTLPTLSGTPALGQTLTCSTGTWANNPTSFSYTWLRSGVPIAGQAGSTYVVQGADGGHTISCQVTAGNAGGDYTIVGLPSGSYKVEFFPGYETGNNYLEQFYNGKAAFGEATPVVVAAPTATGAINAELHAGGQIGGVVTDAATHAPLAEIYVCAEEVSTIGVGGCSLTGANGEYTIVGLTSGSYMVSFESLFNEGYMNQFYNGKSSFSEAQPVAVTVGTTTAGINAELHAVNQGGAISGTVTKAVGIEAIEGIDVCASGSVFGDCALTNSKGEYTISGLPEGSFKVYFSADSCGPSSCTQLNYINQYYNDKTSSGTADQVSVLAGTTTTGIDAKMATGGEIEGRVTSAAGEAPLANAQACAYEGETSICATTNGNGEYKIAGLPTGSAYTVSFYSYSGNYLVRYYNERSAATEADHVAVTAGAKTTAINAKLVEGGQISGRVTDAATHAPLTSVEVCAGASSIEFGSCATTSTNGEYTISALASGTYQVTFYPEGETNDLQLSEAGISVTQGALTPNVNAALQAGGQISGRVTDASTHAGITKIDVCAQEIGGVEAYRCANTTAGAASASAGSNALTVPGSNFTQVKAPVYDAKKGQLDFFFRVLTAGKFRWSLFFRNADVGFADSLSLSLDASEGGSTGTAVAEAAKKKKKAKGCKKGTIKHHGKCVKLLVPFGSGSQNVAAGTVEIKVRASSKALKALNAGRTLHVSGAFTFQSSLGGPAVTHSVSAVVRKPKTHSKKHGKGHKH